MINLFKKEQDGEQVVFAIQGMHCTSCGMNIDGELEDTDGVISAVTSYAESKTKIIFDSQKVTKEELIAVIESLNYTAKEVSS